MNDSFAWDLGLRGIYFTERYDQIEHSNDRCKQHRDLDLDREVCDTAGLPNAFGWLENDQQ